MQRSRLVLGLFSVGLAMGALLGLAGNIWVEFYVKYLHTGSWMLDLSFSFIVLALIALCVFLAANQLFRSAGTFDTKGATEVQRDFRITIPSRFARQLSIGPGDRVTLTLDQGRLVMEKRTSEEVSPKPSI